MNAGQRGGAAPPPSRIVPPGALAAAAALVALALAAAFILPHGPRDAGTAPAAVERQRLLRFADRQDGAVVVTDAADGRLVGLITGQSGFLRGTMSGLARIRRTEGIGAEPPFALTLYDNDRLVLDDPTTGKSIDLEAFGPTNEAVFAQLLPP